jgi:hypothetical protein
MFSFTLKYIIITFRCLAFSRLKGKRVHYTNKASPAPATVIELKIYHMPLSIAGWEDVNLGLHPLISPETCLKLA